MPKKLDYTAAWSEAMLLLGSHREAVIAIAGFFLFAVGWASAFLVPDPGLKGMETLAEMVELLRAHFAANWMVIVPSALVGAYGGFSIYVLLSRPDMVTIGDALTEALKRFLPYFVASILTGWMTFIGLLAVILPGFYLLARFVVLPATVATRPELGIFESIRESWAITSRVGWATFFLLFIVAVVTWLITVVANLLVGLVCVLLAGPEGVPLIETGVAALLSTGQGLIFIALIVAIYRQLQPQAALDASAIE